MEKFTLLNITLGLSVINIYFTSSMLSDVLLEDKSIKKKIDSLLGIISLIGFILLIDYISANEVGELYGII